MREDHHAEPPLSDADLRELTQRLTERQIEAIPADQPREVPPPSRRGWPWALAGVVAVSIVALSLRTKHADDRPPDVSGLVPRHEMPYAANERGRNGWADAGFRPSRTIPDRIAVSAIVNSLSAGTGSFTEGPFDRTLTPAERQDLAAVSMEVALYVRREAVRRRMAKGDDVTLLLNYRTYNGSGGGMVMHLPGGTSPQDDEVAREKIEPEIKRSLDGLEDQFDSNKEFEEWARRQR